MGVSQFLTGLRRIELVNGQLPNKAYDTRSLEMVEYDNSSASQGIGWSALDIARMLMALRILERHAPEFGDPIRHVVARWDLKAMARDGELWGARVVNGQLEPVQEGRLGYEQYAARAAALWGLDVLEATQAARYLNWTDIEGQDVPIDARVSQVYRAITPTLSEPYVLMGLELGFDSQSQILADRVYAVQEARFRRQGQFTALSEDHIDQEPYFLYASVFSNGQDWAVVTEDGKHHPELRSLSLKAAFGWHALYGTQYTQALLKELEGVNSTKGWAAGRYETDGRINAVYTLNTNAVVLEAIHYMVHGPLWSMRPDPLMVSR